MMRFIKFFLIFIALYHILNTILVYGFFGGKFSGLFSILKDFLWIGFFFIVFITNLDKVKGFFLKYRTLILLSFFLTIWSFGVSFYEGKSFGDMMIGFKYGILFVFVFLSALFIGYTIKQKDKSTDDLSYFKSVSGLIFFMYYLVLLILVSGGIWQVLKFIDPNMFMNLGYGQVGDYVAGHNPPLYYRTGPGGLTRFSGIFAGPNNIGYFTVLFSVFFVMLGYRGLIYRIIKSSFTNCTDKSCLIMPSWFQSFKTIVFDLFAFIVTLLTYSRGALIGIAFAFFMFFKNFFASRKKYLMLSIVLITVFVGGLSIFKWGSSVKHFYAGVEALGYVVDNPLGHGLGTSGPSIHYNGYLLPENMYLQIMIDIGVIGFTFWILFFYELYKNLFSSGLVFSSSDLSDDRKIVNFVVFLLSVGLVGLMLEGLFLHIFEDSMVNYLFFVFYGVLVGFILE